MPARASFLTERYVRDHGVFQNDYDVPEHFPTFLQQLQRAGYYTGCIGKMHLYVHARARGDTRNRIEWMRARGLNEPIETVGKHAQVSTRTEYSDELEANGLYDRYREWMGAHRQAVACGSGSWMGARSTTSRSGTPARSRCRRRRTSTPGSAVAWCAGSRSTVASRCSYSICRQTRGSTST